MTDREQDKAFTDALVADVYDEITHRVYADWLYDRGRDEQAEFHARWTPEWQREWDASKEYLGIVCEGISSPHDEVTLDDLTEAVVQYLEDGSGAELGSGAGMALTNWWFDDENREQFWQHWETYTGKIVDESQRAGEPFRCCY